MFAPISAYCSVKNFAALLVMLLSVMWIWQIYNYLRQSEEISLDSDAKPTEKITEKKFYKEPTLPKLNAPTRNAKPSRMRTSKRERKQNHTAIKKQGFAPIVQTAEIESLSLEEYTPTTFEDSSDDENCSSSKVIPIDQVSVIPRPVVINGTTYYYPHIFNEMTQSDVYEIISKHLKVSMKSLKENGYPFFKTITSKTATINPSQHCFAKKLWIERGEKYRTCSRCTKEFQLWKNKKNGQTRCAYFTREGYFEMRETHVFDQLYINELDYFVQAERPSGKGDPRSTKILALDAEMVYTLAGPALARLSVIDWYGNLVLDIKVKPPTKVIDVNTEYSGLTMKDVNGARDSLATCRHKFLQLINAETILVGHSLESDLKALRLVHYNIVDTSLLYKFGEKKTGLKTLARDHLGQMIQSYNQENFGHDSQEDARACLDLVKLKIQSSFV